jgi:hypothetical protein
MPFAGSHQSGSQFRLSPASRCNCRLKAVRRTARSLRLQREQKYIAWGGQIPEKFLRIAILSRKSLKANDIRRQEILFFAQKANYEKGLKWGFWFFSSISPLRTAGVYERQKGKWGEWEDRLSFCFRLIGHIPCRLFGFAGVCHWPPTLDSAIW